MDDPGRFRSHGAGAAYPLGNKLARVIWQLSWLLLARWTPPFFWAWRRMVLRVFGAQIGWRRAGPCQRKNLAAKPAADRRRRVDRTWRGAV